MFALVSAVMRTSITLPVQQRIAEGLSRAGASNTLKVVSYNAILGVIAGCTRGATRQFCALAVVVLVAHWFLVHTFFIAVLSIDIQRLELDDLLRQNTSRVSSPKNDRTRPISPRPKTAWSRFFVGVRDLLKGRASRNMSLLLVSLIRPLWAELVLTYMVAASRYQRYAALRNLPGNAKRSGSR
jgi:hypothetical protein